MRKLLPALVILLLAVVLRTHQIATLPPGPHYDEAANVLITRSIAFGGAQLFPIANSYQGRETLYHYLGAAGFHLFGDRAFTLQIISLYSGVLTVALTIALGAAMFRGRRGLLVGIGAGALLAISLHHIALSRQGYRAITLPLMQAAALWTLWRGLNARRDWPWLLAGGVLAGATLYTYMAARLFPVWLALAGLALLWFDRARWRLRLRQGVIFFAAMTLAAGPMIVYALENPDIFWQRLGEVTDESDTRVTLEHSLRRHAEMFFIRGEDGNLRYNPTGRPYFTPVGAILLLAGVAAAILTLLRGRSAIRRTAAFLALLAPVMVIPSLIALGGMPPNHMRSLGMVPLIFILAGMGFAALVALLQRWLAMRLIVTGAALMLAAGGLVVWNDYHTWITRADLFYQADADLAAAVAWLPAHVDDGTLLYVASFHREHPTVISAWDGPVTWLGFDSLFLPPPDRDALIILAHAAPLPPAWLDWLAPFALDDLPPGPDGAPAFAAYRVPGAATLDLPGDPAPDIANPLMTLRSFDSAPIPAGQTGAITMAWHIDQSPPYYRLRPILRLHDPTGALLSETDAFLLATDRWRPGETMFQQMRVSVPPATPPGDYPLDVLWVDRDSDTYVGYVDGAGQFAGIRAELGTVTVTRPDSFPAPESLPITVRTATDLEPGVRLLGCDPPVSRARPGETLHPTLYWHATPADSRAAPQMTVVLTGAAGEIVLWQGTPLEDRHPVARWQTGEVLAERVAWSLPRDLPGGDYTLQLRSGDLVRDLGPVRVDGLARVFAPPPVDERLDLRLGDSLGLHGYSVETADGTLTLTLVWQAHAEVAADYTVFVHLYDENGILVEQRDAMPQANGYPTGLWVAGEYVADTHTFTALPPGSYDLHIGLYLQSSGVRLPVFTQNGRELGDFTQIGTILLEPYATNN